MFSPWPGQPGQIPVNTDEDSGSYHPDLETWTGARRNLEEASYNVWKAVCGIADLYLECGWDVNVVMQTDFRWGEFVDERDEYIGEVVHALQDEWEERRRSGSLGACMTNCSQGSSMTERKMCSWNVAVEVSGVTSLNDFMLSCAFMRVIPPYRVRHGLSNRTTSVSITTTLLPSVVKLVIAVILERRVPAIIRRVHSRVITAVDMSRVAAHRYLVVFQVASPGAPRAACLVVRGVAIGGAAELGSHAEDVAEDVFEERF
jgi:hypothetical protein